LFIDEIDALVGARSFGSSGESGGDVVQGRVLASFLTEMDGIGATDGGVVLVGATNRLEVRCHVHFLTHQALNLPFIYRCFLGK
jgi:ATP-dependent Zn protease